MPMSAFKQFTPTQGLLMTDIALQAAKPYVEVAEYVDTKGKRRTDRPRRLALRTRRNGSHYFTWKDQSGQSQRIDTQDFVVAF